DLDRVALAVAEPADGGGAATEGAAAARAQPVLVALDRLAVVVGRGVGDAERSAAGVVVRDQARPRRLTWRAERAHLGRARRGVGRPGPVLGDDAHAVVVAVLDVEQPAQGAARHVDRAVGGAVAVQRHVVYVDAVSVGVRRG